MIVRETKSSLLLITQPDHAVLARQIMEPWAALAGATRRGSILHAILEHDNGWRESDSSPIVDPATGWLFDFISAPVGVRRGVWPHGVARLSEDPWAAALVAQHAVTVYDRFRADPDWSTFFSTMTATRDQYLAASELTLGDLEQDYVFLRVGDLASLAFCNAWTEEQRFDRYTVRLDGSRLVITPDPYSGSALPFEVTARELPRRPFTSEADARTAFLAAPILTLTGQAMGRD